MAGLPAQRDLARPNTHLIFLGAVARHLIFLGGVLLPAFPLPVARQISTDSDRRLQQADSGISLLVVGLNFVSVRRDDV